MTAARSLLHCSRNVVICCGHESGIFTSNIRESKKTRQVVSQFDHEGILGLLISGLISWAKDCIDLQRESHQPSHPIYSLAMKLDAPAVCENRKYSAAALPTDVPFQRRTLELRLERVCHAWRRVLHAARVLLLSNEAQPLFYGEQGQDLQTMVHQATKPFWNIPLPAYMSLMPASISKMDTKDLS